MEYDKLVSINHVDIFWTYLSPISPDLIGEIKAVSFGFDFLAWPTKEHQKIHFVGRRKKPNNPK